MQLIYTTGVRFRDERRTSVSRVILDAFTLKAFEAKHLQPSCLEASRLYVADSPVSMPWPHHLYVLVNTDREHENVQFLVTLLTQALHLYRRQHERSNAPEDAPAPAPRMQPKLIVDLAPVLFDVVTSLTSLYDVLSVHTDDRDATTSAGNDLTLNRHNNLYRCRLQTLAELRHLAGFLRDNNHAWQDVYALPANLLFDHFRFALDVYVSNLQFQTNQAALRQCADSEPLSARNGADDPTGSADFYRKMLHKWKLRGSAATAFSRDPIDPKRWFACMRWCLIDVTRARLSLVPAEDFAFCVRSVLRLGADTVSDQQIAAAFECPLSLVPHIVWDVETVARGIGTIPRGVYADQALSSVAVVFERPELDRGRVIVLWLLKPPSYDEAVIERVRSSLLAEPALRVQHVIIRAYRHERALLHDFLFDMFANYGLLVDFFGLRPTSLHHYPDVASLLIGHNTIEYDYRFLLDRTLFHAMRIPAWAMQRFSAMQRPTCRAFVFNEAQLCLDTMQHLIARNRQLKSYKLSAVLSAYCCAIEKIDFPATTIRQLYYDPQQLLRTHPDLSQFLFDVMRYNAFDCFSLCDLMQRMSFAQHMTVMSSYFYATLESVMYKGNSNLLPTLIQLESLQLKREMSCVRAPQQNVFLAHGAALEATVATNCEFLLSRFGITLSLERPFRASDCCNPFARLLQYQRTVRLLLSPSGQVAVREHSLRLDTDELVAGTLALTAASEIELLRVGVSSYVGGMNFALPGHAKFPILVDYNSFYPSIIRSYRLDTCTVAVLSLRQILLMFPLPLFDYLLSTRIFRTFDYTSLQDRCAVVVDDERHAALCDRAIWHEAFEYETVERLVRSSLHIDRRFLVLLYRPQVSTIDVIVTKALERRAVWKRRKAESPNDNVVSFNEMMEKLLANSMYGYLNFKQSAVFSRATAAAVTLLCRNAFCHTRAIIESRELVASTDLDADRHRFKLVYIDTDGCIFVLTRTDSAATTATDHRLAGNAHGSTPWFQLYLNIEASDTVAAYKRLTATINRMLNLEHVLLAPEHEDSVSASVFTTKKYVLLKRDGSVKRTGFESNASRPIRDMYEVALRNTLTAFHTRGLVPHAHFVYRIVHHRLFLFAVFDHLYERWRSNAYSLQDFGICRPLNPKQTGGEMSAFIDRVLRDLQYSAGERVWIIKAIDPRHCVVDSALCPARGRFMLIEELAEEPGCVPCFKFFLGAYARYLYQCIESQQTLRDSSANTREPVEWSQNRPLFWLNSFTAVYAYSWAAWLYTRLYRQDKRVHGVWRSNTPTAGAHSQKVAYRVPDEPTKLPSYLPREHFDRCVSSPVDLDPHLNPYRKALFHGTNQTAEWLARFWNDPHYAMLTALPNE